MPLQHHRGRAESVLEESSQVSTAVSDPGGQQTALQATRGTFIEHVQYMYRSIPSKCPCTAFHGFNTVASFYTKYVYLIANLTSCMYLSIPTAPDAAASFGAAGVPRSSAPPLSQTHPIYRGVYGHQLTHGHGSSHPFC